MSDHRARPETAPGDETIHAEQMIDGVVGYSIGLALAALLTVVSFVLPTLNLVWAPSLPVALAVLAIAQMGVHLVFFIHITSGPDNINNVLALMEQLQSLDRELTPVSDAIRDTARLSGSEAYRLALLFYRSLKSAQRENIGSSAQVYGDLANRFPGKRAKKTSE